MATRQTTDDWEAVFDVHVNDPILTVGPDDERSDGALIEAARDRFAVHGLDAEPELYVTAAIDPEHEGERSVMAHHFCVREADDDLALAGRAIAAHPLLDDEYTPAVTLTPVTDWATWRPTEGHIIDPARVPPA